MKSKVFGCWRSRIGKSCLKPGMQDATVVRHDIQDQAHTPFGGCFAQRNQGRVAAKVRIDIEKIGYVIMMVAVCAEDRIEVQRVDAQVLEVVQVFLDTGQIPAKEFHHTGAAGYCGCFSPRAGNR